MMEDLDDKELWRRCQEDDADAFAALFDRYQQPVYSYCFRRVADWTAAEDLTSTVFLEAWRKRHRVELRDGLLGPWLLGVATNVVRNQRRAIRRYRSVLERIPRLRPEADFAADLDERVDAARQMEDLLDQLRHLPRPEREVLALRWEGLSHSEIAAALGTSGAVVRGRLFRARRRLGAAGLDVESEPHPSCQGANS